MYDISEVVKRQYKNVENYVEGNYGGREKSWEWCHNVFLANKNKLDNDTIDYLALNLFAYLGSFGMFRNSKLLDCDYKIFKDLIKNIIQHSDYNELYNVDPLEKSDDEITELIFGEHGIFQKISVYLSVKGITDTDTLVTKILLGTYSCLPAYDRFLKDGICFHNTNICEKDYPDFGKHSTVKKDSYKKCAEFYKKYHDEFERENTLKYPPMKLVDMYFNELGYELGLIDALDDNKKSKKVEKMLVDLKIITGTEKDKKQDALKKYSYCSHPIKTSN